MSRMVGVDIGATAVRAVEVAGVDSNGFAIVTRLAIVPLEPGSVVAGRIRNPKNVSTAVLAALREAKLPRYGVVLGLSSPDTAIARMALPAVIRADEREGAIRALDRPVAPTFTLEDSSLSTQSIRVDTAPDGAQTAIIAVAAALRAEVEMVQQVCRLARVTPRALDLAGAATVRSLTRLDPSSNEVATVVDIGASKTTVATRAGMHLRSLRVTAGAGSDLTRAIAAITGEEFDIAERRKITYRLKSAALQNSNFSYGFEEDEQNPDALTPVDKAVSAAVDALVDSVAQAIENDAANHGSYTQGVTLCGGTSLLRGLKDRMQQRVGVPVQIGRPWAEIERSSRNAAFFAEGVADPRVLLSIATATGLALWKEPS
jgi:type IV pilus assembly protein PilM